MKNANFYYSSSICEFLRQSNEEILGKICSNDPHSATRLQQRNTWETEIAILKRQLSELKEG